MAKRSDFAQKLLDDLRLRKERMAAPASPSHRSNQSNHLPIDAYAYTKQTYRGSRTIKANEIVSSRSGEMLNRCSSSRRNRSINTGELSNQIIPYGKGQSLGDMSQALAFAFENGGKLRRADFSYTNSIMGFLHQIKRGTMERGSNLDRQLASTSHYPTLSLVQINEISKGAQKLNHILRACSSGLNMDTYSLQFAKELLQGAIDLEESLRMLVDLQKSSEFMITPQAQKKNRITLLELDNDNDNDIDEEDKRRRRKMEQMQLAHPIFSFDKMQRPIKEARKIKVSEKGISTTSSSERKNQTATNPDKARIPNVIAKLMGLDNLPEKKVEMESKHVLLKKDSVGNAQKLELTSSKHTVKGSNFTTLKNKETGNVMKNQKVVGAIKIPSTLDEELMFGAHKKGSAQKNLIRESQNYVQVMMGRKQDHPNNSNREQKGAVKGRPNDLVQNNMLEQVHERSQVKSSHQVAKEINASIVQPENRRTNTNKHILSNENKSQDHLGVQKSYSCMLPKNGPQEQKQLQLREEKMLTMGPQGWSEMAMTTKNSPHQWTNNPQKKKPSINQPTPFKTNHDEASNNKVKEIMNKKSGQICSPRYQEFEPVKGKHVIKTLKDEKHVHKLATKKIKNTIKQKVDQMLTGRNGQGKQQIPSLQEARDRASGKFNVLNGAEKDRFIEADAPINIISSNIPRKEAELPPNLYNSGAGEFQSQQGSANKLHYHDVQSVAINLQDQAAPGAADEGFKTGKAALHKTNGIQEDGVGFNHSKSKLRDLNISEISIGQPLTESENCLKWILVMSQLFVNTAEALFRLNIPFSVLQGGRQDNQDEGSKLILDCGYEVMKRKGIRQELKVHNCSKISISTVNIRSLDDLVRQLNEDMEKLKFYGREKSTQIDVEEYLPKMLEHDVYDKYPDIDCMWDFGWNGETFAFIEKYDVIRDTEKHILSVLLDEITKDCCMFNEY